MQREIQVVWEDLSQELSAFIYGKVKDKEVSKDLLQDTFLKIHLNIHKE
jgi:RNA polymerase sigma-70 factor (ECF subfamily)